MCLIAGGSGITYPLSNALDIIRRARAMHLGHTGAGIAIATKRLSIVWIVKEASQVEWIGQHLRDMLDLAPPGLLHVNVYVTADPGTPNIMAGYVTSDSRRGAAPVSELPNHASRLELHSGRPKFDVLIEDEVQATRYSE